MYFGQCNSPATFQTFMNMIMIQTQDKHSLWGMEIIIYMDDILIATKDGATIEDHRAMTWDVLQVLQDDNLFLKLEKCIWESPHIDYLGLILEKGVTSMDPAKVKGVKSWPIPTMVKQVHSFLGFCNFYCTFIHGFSHLAKPLNKLTKKDHPWTWEQAQQSAFDTLKSRIVAEPVLIQPHLDQTIWTRSGLLRICTRSHFDAKGRRWEETSSRLLFQNPHRARMKLQHKRPGILRYG